MKTLLFSICALAIVAAPVYGEDENEKPKQPKNNRTHNPPPQRQAPPPRVVAPRVVTPRVQQTYVAPKPQFQQHNKPPVTARTYAPPKSYTPQIQARLRNNSPRQFTPVDRDAPRTVSPTMKNDAAFDANNRNWRTRPRTDTTVVPPQTPTTVTPNTNLRNRDGRNRDRRDRDRTTNNRNRNWQNNTTNYNTYTFDQARRRHHRERHDRSWWRSRYNRIVLFGGGYYYWNDGYWYPAYGYDPYYSTYAYDEPIYGYNNLSPGEVIANVQTALQEQGYYHDEVDGLIGPNTRAALRDFQRDHGLPVTAAIDGPTLRALGLY
jgi:peptidoglycan hydrolase-like protein with peptidoglycan-binding domain